MRRLVVAIIASFIIAFVPPTIGYTQQQPAPAASSATTQSPAVNLPAPATGAVVTVRGDTATISGGTLAGQILVWAALLIGAPLAGLIAAWIVKLLQKLGVDISDSNRKRLQEFVENGIALGAKRASADLSGKLNVDVKNRVAADALIYVQDHGADTIKALGFDPQDKKAVEAMQARIAKALDDKAAVAAAMPVTVVPQPAA